MDGWAEATIIAGNIDGDRQKMATVKLRINGDAREIEADPAMPLIFALRNHFGLVGAKLGCGLEQCGACAVLVDGEPVLSCVRAVSEFEDADIVTIEGLTEDGKPSAIQQAFIDEGAAQCGYCTAGIVVATTALLENNKNPSKADIAEALSDHLCRCGSHARVLAAIARVTGGEA
jgi:aerobic-type carbon monoxide dehydrogenase small subunit (CoxS/CutS family)